MKRPRASFRVLYNHDCANVYNCTSPFHARGADFEPTMLEESLNEIQGTGVNACMLSPGFGWVPWWRSRAYPVRDHFRWLKDTYGLEPDTMGKYLLDGGDVMEVYMQWVWGKGVSPFVSLRLDDSTGLEFLKCNREMNAPIPQSFGHHLNRYWWKAPDTYRLDRDPDGLQPGDPRQWTDPALRYQLRRRRALNWAMSGVRWDKLSLIRELIENFPIEGLELDLVHTPPFFAEDGVDEHQRCKILADYIREIRKILNWGKGDTDRRWMSVRVPNYLAHYRPAGIDIVSMTFAGVDMVVLSGGMFCEQRNDLAEIRAMLPETSVYVELTPITEIRFDQFRRTTDNQLYTSAHLAYARGADGVSLSRFAYYREHVGGERAGPFREPPFHVLRNMGDRNFVASQPQHYFVGGSAYGAGPRLPFRLEPGQSITFVMDMCPPTDGWQVPGRLRLHSRDQFGIGNVIARVNGRSLTGSEEVVDLYKNPHTQFISTIHNTRAWSVDPSILKDGHNAVTFISDLNNPVEIAFVDLAMPASDESD